MLYFEEMSLYIDILRKTKKCQLEQVERLYNDAMIGLYQLGVEPEETEEGLAIVINDESFKVSDFVMKIVSKGRIEKKTAISPKKDDVAKKTAETTFMGKNDMEIDMDEGLSVLPNEKEKQDKKKADLGKLEKITMENIPNKNDKKATPDLNYNQEQLAILDKHSIKIVNKKNPSNIEGFNVTVIPLFVTDNMTSTDIAVEVEHNGESVLFVSEKGRKSILAEIAGFTFNIRGQWRNRRFKSLIYVTGGDFKRNYSLEDSNVEIRPVSLIDEKVYSDTFTREVGSTRLYVLPLENSNEPNGKCRVTVISEDTEDETRKISEGEQNVLLMYINNNSFRVYARWIKKEFEISIEATQ